MSAQAEKKTDWIDFSGKYKEKMGNIEHVTDTLYFEEFKSRYNTVTLRDALYTPASFNPSLRETTDQRAR